MSGFKNIYITFLNYYPNNSNIAQKMILGASKNPVEIKTPFTNMQYLSIIDSIVVYQSYQITIIQIIQKQTIIKFA